MEETNWVSAHAFHQGDQDRLLIDAVDPLVTELISAGRADGWFYLRYWDGGPHVRLRVLPAAGTDPGEIRAAIDRSLGAYYRDNPSTPVVTEDAYAQSAAMLAAWEQVEPGFTSLQPNDSVAYVPYRREHHRYGHGAAIEAVERHFVQSSTLAMRLLRQGASPQERSTAAYAMILIAWLTCEPDPLRLRERIESGPGYDDRAAPFELPQPSARRLRTAVSVAQRMRALVAARERHTDAGTLAGWARSVATLRDALDEQLGRGTLEPPASGWEGPGGIVTAGPDTSVLTIVDICAHLVCNRLSVTLPAEISLRQLAGAAVSALAEGN
ncbi:thiopeptide-type bacteriocin biosynthesis domain-containing protein [Micromonospora citrea]|uniref:Thiopeptide-type bacteriocin biosynthesis domain-containing protein n=1 Tax=Micromonospora citrea TaxID=47855 RepID=A0A1C6TT39_9ACTN|nr:lantibiotic dehydratase C-terminal domain-containing protein [Micromonospora citrea]SCL44848.1 thiopeptide-type bacteriocin biosynthesis domain-containing protein [Micromonospora citrea]